MNECSNRFRLNSRGLMLAMISAAFAQPVLANSGKVDFAAGNVTATGADHQPRTLTKGAEVKSGDSIVTTDGRAQIRFSDGSYVSLQPNTQFDIKEYVYDGKTDGSESAVFSLFKGALRTVTGLVGRVHRDKYKIATPTATIGIRGTGGVISIGADGSTLVQGTSGVWTMTNTGGSLEIPAGTAGFAGPNQSKPPEQSTQGPNPPPPPPTQQPPTYTQGDSRNQDGTNSLFTPLVTGPGYAVADGGEGANLSTFFPSTSVPVNAVFDTSGRMTQFSTNSEGGLVTFTLAGTHAEFATVDGVLAWGRWIGQVNIAFSSCPTCNSSVDFSPNQGLHYVVGTPTSAASMPTNVIYTYNMIGATSPTFGNGATAPGALDLTRGSLTGNFINNTVNVNFVGAIGGMNFTAAASGSINTTNATFFGCGSYTGSLASCGGGTSVSGFFAGNGATHAGMTYELFNTVLGNSGGSVYGAAAFKR